MSGVAFLFPGQGSQYSGMGLALAQAFAESRSTFAEADDALGAPISELCFRGSDADLARTENTQPAVLAVCVAALRALGPRVPPPAAAAGHSLGEYAAHVAAGSLEFAAALRCVRERGRFMQEAVPAGEGAMAALVGLGPEVVERVCAEASDTTRVWAANFNAPEQIVVAGHRGAVERACAAALRAGARRAVPLAVSAPFHCPLMEPAARRLARLLDETELRDPRFPIYANVDARPVVAAEPARAALVRQVTSPVRWVETIEAMVASGIGSFLELGPGRVLTGLVRRIRRDVRTWNVQDPDGLVAVVDELVAAR